MDKITCAGIVLALVLIGFAIMGGRPKPPPQP